VFNATQIPLDQAPQDYADLDRQGNSPSIRTGCLMRDPERAALAYSPFE
jgi:hypothetical protein